MGKILVILIGICYQQPAYSQDKADIAWLSSWLKGWEWLSEKKYQLESNEIPELYFFDSLNYYTNNPSAGNVKIEGPSIFNKPQPWVKGTHTGTLNLPNGEKVPAGLMSFAGALPGHKPFFVMAAPSVWEKLAVPGYGLTVKDLSAAVFLHEYSHSQQLDGFGKRVDSLEQKHGSDSVLIDDDIIQRTFRADCVYVKTYREELGLFYKALWAKGKTELKDYAGQALAMMNKRHQSWIEKGNQHYAVMDDIFLTMEGLGQYSSVLWLTDKDQRNLPFRNTVEAFRRNGRIWSQDEGMVMFLILARLKEPDWKNDMFGSDPKMIRELLQKAIAEN